MRAAAAGADLDVQHGVQVDPVGRDTGLAVQEIEEPNPGDSDRYTSGLETADGHVLGVEFRPAFWMLVSNGRAEYAAGSGISVPSTLRLRSTAVGTVAVALTAGAGAVLILLATAASCADYAVEKSVRTGTT